MHSALRNVLLPLLTATTAAQSACTVAVDDRGTGLPTDVQEALSALPRAEVIVIGADGLPTFVRGDLGMAAAGKLDLADAEAALSPTIGAIAPVFRVAPEDLHLDALDGDELGFTHALFRQTKHGLDVVGGELRIHLDPAGTVYAAHGTARDGVELHPAPALLGSAALDRVRAAANPEARLTWSAPDLVYVVVSRDGTLHLAWETVEEGFLGEEPVRDRVYVDGLSGEIIDRHPEIVSARNRKIYDAGNRQSLPGTLRISEGGAAVSDSVVMAAYANVGATHDCYQALFGRDSYDGAGAPLVATVHFGTRYDNAYWNGSQMVFGDGDGSEFGPFGNALDITAHEITHALTDETANLVYQNEPGALNEAMSDIVAAACEAWRDGGVNGDTWKVGEDIFTPGVAGDAPRVMDDPTADGWSTDYYPERYTGYDDNGGVHFNSGIGNLAFKLLVTGGAHPRGKTTVNVSGIGMDRASKIFYRALTVYMGSNTTFESARVATVQAATDLYGATTAASVTAAWDAVGVPGGGNGGGNGGGGTGGGGTGGDTGLEDGVPAAGLAGATGSMTFFTFEVPAGASVLSIQMSGGSGDADLYVRHGAAPTLSVYDHRPYKSGNAESVSVSAPAAGTWHVLVHGYAAYAGLTLVATAGGGAGGNDGGAGGDDVLGNGQAVTGIAGAAGGEARFTFQVPAGATGVRVQMSGGTGDADLYVKVGSAPTISDWEYRPYVEGNDETVSATGRAGTWHVLVHGYTAFSGVTLVATY